MVVMTQKLSEPVTVEFLSDGSSRRLLPKSIYWNGRLYQITKVGLRHTHRQGRTLFHIFSVLAHTLYFRLSLNTDNLLWQLEEISDGLPG